MIYSTRLIASGIRCCMKKTLLTVILIFSLFPISTSFSQISDKEPTLGIVLTSFTPFNYKDEDGTTIIIGEVENTKNFPITGVKIWAGFYDDISEQPLETTFGKTILEVIPPLSKSPYLIKSPSPNAAITNVSVNLLGFNSSPPKQALLSLDPGTLNIGNQLTLSGTITNNGAQNSTNTRIYLVSYDPFVPPRVLGIATTEIEADFVPGSIMNFEFDAKRDSRVASFKLVAESNNYQSEFIDITSTKVDVITKLVTISDISVNDIEGNRLSDVSVGFTVDIQSGIWIEYSGEQEAEEQPYVYYIQIKQSGEKAFVEFIGKAEGTFQSAGQQFPTVGWTPQNPGLYFIETFVWDPNAVPLASKGPISLILVN